MAMTITATSFQLNLPPVEVKAILTPQERDALLDMHSAITRYAQVSEWRQRP